MKKIYNVVHHYDVDGGFGDSISQKEILFTTSDKEVAEKFIDKYSNDHIYDVPYSELHRGLLKVEELQVIEFWSDIPKEIIEWGEKNEKESDYNPDDYNQDYEFPISDWLDW